ncbi:MAG TPA: response regulator [Kofleriaceae bacterium]|nr:response regulator [Kofleriaceae bacterium]
MKILVVDDNVELAEMIAAHLRLYAHDVVVALDGASALRAVRREQVDAILLDVGLPDVSGYEVARTLRDGILQRKAVIALFTGDGEPSFDRAKAVGVDLVLRKPLAPDELRILLGFLHDRRQQRVVLT